MKSDRLLSILLLLQTRGRVSAAELAERLEVSVRTIYRDVAALSAAGVPVYAERGRHGGIALLPGYRTDVTGLTADEARALFVLGARGTHEALGLGGALGSALRKVMAALPAPHRPAAEVVSQRILVDQGRWYGRREREPEALPALRDAVFSDRRLRLRYRRGGESRARTYTVDPYGLVAKAGVWYLVADRAGAERMFRADRVVAAEVLPAPVRRRPGVDLAGLWESMRRRVDEAPVAVRVEARVRRARLDLFEDVSGAAVEHADGGEPGERDERGDERGDDWVNVVLSYPQLSAVRQVLAFGTDVEVTGPPEAVRFLAQTTAALAARYAATAET